MVPPHLSLLHKHFLHWLVLVWYNCGSLYACKFVHRMTRRSIQSIHHLLFYKIYINHQVILTIHLSVSLAQDSLAYHSTKIPALAPLAMWSHHNTQMQIALKESEL